MKLLIAYDGSPCSEAAIDDLCQMGLPAEGSALVVTVAETWLPPPESELTNGDQADPYLESIVEKYRLKGERLLTEAGIKAKHGSARVRKALEQWTVHETSTYGSPAFEILAAADEFEPDVIVVGSHSNSPFARWSLGSVSQKVLTEASCSVRIARGRVEVEPGPNRIIIGFDASPGSSRIVDWIGARNWPSGSEARLITAVDPILPNGIRRFISPVLAEDDSENEETYRWLRDLASDAKQLLSEKTGMKVTAHLISADPKNILVSEAETWHADTIFVGANVHASKLERFLLGSTSSAVSARAQCSVEVVRSL